jgi:hypothetical protein
MKTATDLVIASWGRWSRAGAGDQPYSGGGGFDDADFNLVEAEFGGVKRVQEESGIRYVLPRRGLYLVTATLMLNHGGAGVPCAIRILDENEAVAAIRQWNFYSTAEDYLSWCVSAVVAIASDTALHVQWQGATALVARESMGNECSWLEITRIGDSAIRSLQRRGGPIGGGGGPA